MSSPTISPRWWHSATIYEIYPSSFKDSNNDGVGDIPGIISQIPYIASLGVDAVWLAACCKSGGVDNGYDVIDYREIDAQFGTVGDVETLIAELGKREIKLIMDLVVNHTSSQHEWFKESRQSRDSAKRDWYIWRPGRTRNLPPNNWKSCFSGPAWTYDPVTSEWYLHMFSPSQPDLNWTNPDVRSAVYEDMRFWLDKGIAGFRMDVINIISKPAGLPMAGDVMKELQSPLEIVCNEPTVHEYLREMRREVLDGYGDVVSVGEVICTGDVEVIKEYTDPDRKELSMAYTFDLFALDIGNDEKFSRRDWKPLDLKNTIIKWQTGLAFSHNHWQTLWLESHDSARSVTRFGSVGSTSDQNRRWKVAKMLALLQSTLGGTIFLYQGQEIGMKNLSAEIPVEEYRDLETHALIQAQRDKGREEGGLLREVLLKARDHARAPMQWSAATRGGLYAGFSECEPWSPMGGDSAVCNVAAQRDDGDSVLSYWRRRIRLRREYADVLVFGDFEVVEGTVEDDDDAAAAATAAAAVFAYWRVPLPRIGGRDRSRVEGGGASSQIAGRLEGRSGRTREVLVVIHLGDGELVHFTLPPDRHGQAMEFVLLDDTCSHEPCRYRATGSVWSGDVLELGAYQGVVLGSA